MKYRPSGNFLLSVGLLILSFFVMQGVVVPSIVRKELGAQALSSRATQSKASTVSGVLLEEHYDELDPHTNQLVIKNQKFYLDTGTGNPTPITVANKSIAESLVNEKVTYKTSNKSLDLDVSATRPITESVSSRESRENIGRDVTPRPGVGTREGKAAVFLVNFESNDRQIPVPLQNPRDIEDYLFDERKGQFQKFFSEVSHGKVSYTGDVFGWYQMPGYGSDSTYQGSLGPCTVRKYGPPDPQPLFESILQNMISAYGVNITDYNTIIIMSRCGDYGTIGGYADNLDFGGQNYYFTEIKGHPTRFDFTGSIDYVNYPSYVGILNHEIGHTFNLTHSNSLDCNEKTVWNNCSVSSYGNAFDTMGYPDGARAYNYRQQLKVGWINPDNILVINQPGSYHLDNLQTLNGLVGAQIYMPNRTDSPLFALEHRKAEGVDSKLENTYLFGNVSSGLLLYAPVYTPGQNIIPFNVNISQWLLSDPHPQPGVGIYQDIQYDAITETNGFLDPITGVGINVTGVTPDGINFDVYYDVNNSICNLNVPIEDVITLTGPAGVVSGASFSAQFQIDLAGDTLCPRKKYELTIADSMTAEWILNETTFTGNVLGDMFYAAHQSLGSLNLTGTIPEGIASGVYELKFTIKDLDTLEEKEFMTTVDYVNLEQDCVVPIDDIFEIKTVVDGVEHEHTSTISMMGGNTFKIKLGRNFLPPHPDCSMRTYAIEPISSNIATWAASSPGGFPVFYAPPNAPTNTFWDFLPPFNTVLGNHEIKFKITDQQTLEEKEYTIDVEIVDNTLCNIPIEDIVDFRMSQNGDSVPYVAGYPIFSDFYSLSLWVRTNQFPSGCNSRSYALEPINQTAQEWFPPGNFNFSALPGSSQIYPRFLTIPAGTPPGIVTVEFKITDNVTLEEKYYSLEFRYLNECTSYLSNDVTVSQIASYSAQDFINVLHPGVLDVEIEEHFIIKSVFTLSPSLNCFLPLSLHLTYLDIDPSWSVIPPAYPPSFGKLAPGQSKLIGREFVVPVGTSLGQYNFQIDPSALGGTLPSIIFTVNVI